MVKSEDLVQTLNPSDRQRLRGGKEDAKYGQRAEELGHGCGSETQEEKECKKDRMGVDHRYYCGCSPSSFTKYIHI